MKHHNRTAAWLVVLIAALAASACGDRQTTASKNAAAYDDAARKGIAVGAGEQGGHQSEPALASPATKTAAMPGMAHGAMSGMDHATVLDARHDPMAGMQHGTATQAAPEMAGMTHSAMPGMQHGTTSPATHEMAGMEHSAPMAHVSMQGMQTASPAAAPVLIEPVTSNATIARTQPASTLRPDEFDAPSPSAVREAARGASGISPERTSPPPPRQHDGHGDAS
jgi:hypothetical protein